ncbi:hypothetical protein [Bradyrhizobium huanghuaihaiense]|uniref:hypothetical protein n=1 Tax=Bradyrhizobium huanghuaihaiense TaxID=990078 RepID=UPI0011A1ED59|nr:hypothetical protein [Bradyrhizobium huanghuaihaiense]
MQKTINVRSQIYDRFHNSTAHGALHGDDFAAYYTSMYLIQDTGEALDAHMRANFSPNPMQAYIEFWGVMQAVVIQQDAIVELYSVVVGGRPIALARPYWSQLRDLRNLCAGHPSRRAIGVPNVQRAFMGRSFGDYNRITYELWDAGGTVTHPVFDLRQMLTDYDGEASSVLQAILTAMVAKWP